VSNEREVQLGTIPIGDPGAAWFAVRNVFRSGDYYEERITLWNAPTFESAEKRAEQAAKEDAEILGEDLLGFAQVYRLFDFPANGTEVFSLIRGSDLEPDAYLSAYFDTGEERQGTM
jgi:hypothetical protein